MARVLVTGAGSDIGIGAIQSLKKTSHETVAVDMNPHAAGIYMADYGVSVPPVKNEDWDIAISSVVKEYGVDVVIPLIDQELQEIGSLRSVLSAEIPIIVPRTELIKKTIDKKEMYEYFDEHGLRIPETSLIENPDELKKYIFPKIVKPRYGQGSEGVQIIRSESDAERYIDKSNISKEPILIQELIKGPEYTSNVAVSTDNRVISVVTKEVPERDGYTALGITRDNSAVYEACMDAFESLEPAGPINVQHMMSNDGVPYLIEINPRFSGSSCLTVEAGVNEFDLLVRDALGETIKSIEDYETGLCMIRYTDQIYIDEKSLR